MDSPNVKTGGEEEEAGRRRGSTSSSGERGEGNDIDVPKPWSVFQRARETVRRRIRPWHIFALFMLVVVVIIVLAIVVHFKGPGGRSQPGVSNPSIAQVNLGYASYQGTKLSNGVNQYLGMRFAAAPVGSLRWRAPIDPPQVSGIQSADAFGKICLGISAPLPNTMQAEDCLFANVWAPSNATVDSKLPVWLFIQGGGYTVNSNANWNGSEVVQRSGNNMILVNFNYRVGLWGFLASERVRANGDLNPGLLDQRIMMKWVQTHIAQFGGDPNHVVIHGASAGAGSVALHLMANGGKNENLFHGAIGESIFFPSQPFVSELEWQFDLVLTQAGCAGVGDSMDCLREKDASALQLTNRPSPFPGGTEAPVPLFYWTPCIDGQLLQDLPYNSFSKGEFIDVPVIFGTDTNEGTYFAPNAASQDEVSNFIKNNYPKLTDQDLTNILDTYPQMDPLPYHNAWFPSAEMAYGEATFICPAVHVLTSFHQQFEQLPPSNTTNTASQRTSHAWGYRYNVLDRDNEQVGLGVPHLWESWAIFGPDNLNGPGTAPKSYYAYNADIVPLVMDYWISFVVALDPNTLRNAAAPAWEPWGAHSRRLLFQTEESGAGNTTVMEGADSGLLGRCGLWEGLAQRTRQRRRRGRGRRIGDE